MKIKVEYTTGESRNSWGADGWYVNKQSTCECCGHVKHDRIAKFEDAATAKDFAATLKIKQQTGEG